MGQKYVDIISHFALTIFSFYPYHIMDTFVAYAVLIFYGVLAILTATAGNYLMPNGGFSAGYVFGALLSVVLWFSVGRKAAKV